MEQGRTEMSKNDLRVAKTRRAIRDTFLRQICTKPVNKITVAGLAREAEINKGTFYLHYADIYALYDEILEEMVAGIADKYDPYPDFFTDPEAFVRVFLFAPAEPPRREELAVFKEENLRFTPKYPVVFVDAFRKKIYDVGKLAPSRENDVKLEYVLTGMLSLLVKPGLLDRSGPDGDPFVISLLAGSIRQLFPAFYPA